MADTDTSAATDRSRTPLLTLITLEALEQDYQDAADHRGAGTRTKGAGSRVLALVVIAGFGVLVALGAAQTTQDADVRDASRAQIIERIENNRTALQDEQDRQASIREENAALEETLVNLGGELGETQSTVTDLEASTGFRAVSGEGIQIRFDNLPDSDPDNDWVRDSDIAALANALWEVGAEAVAVNGQRLTAVGGIRNVRRVVQISSQAIAPPYTVIAIGDRDQLAADLLDTTSGAEFFGLAQQYGWDPVTRSMAEVRVPAAPEELRQLRSAQQPQDVEREEP